MFPSTRKSYSESADATPDSAADHSAVGSAHSEVAAAVAEKNPASSPRSSSALAVRAGAAVRVGGMLAAEGWLVKAAAMLE